MRRLDIVMSRTEQAKLPERHREVVLAEMPVGTTGYLVPWMMRVDSEGRCWLNDKVPLCSGWGTATLWIKKMTEGYIVKPTEHYSWHPESVREGLAPVIKFIG